MLTVIDDRRKPEDIEAVLRTVEHNGDFRLIIVDTFAALFDGSDVNDNVQAGEFVRRLRPLTRLRGLPAVLIAAHPVKNASEDNLLPYGGGAILNEVDGNLTLWKKPDTGLVNLHWQGKLRGLEFKPRSFRFELVTSPDLLDAKGREVQLPVLRPWGDEVAECKEAAAVDRNASLLKIMRANPTMSLRELSAATDIPLVSINRRFVGFEEKEARKEEYCRPMATHTQRNERSIQNTLKGFMEQKWCFCST